MKKQDCIFCNYIKEKKGKVVFEDEKIIAMLDINPASHGHILAMPKEHYSSMQEMPDHLVGKLLNTANKLSVSVFESLNALGTNIMINDGTSAGQKASHLMVQIIPRKENDSMNFQWEPKQLSEEEMSTIELQLKEGAKHIGSFEAEKKEPVKLDQEAEEIKEKPEDYTTKQLDRIP